MWSGAATFRICTPLSRVFRRDIEHSHPSSQNTAAREFRRGDGFGGRVPGTVWMRNDAGVHAAERYDCLRGAVHALVPVHRAGEGGLSARIPVCQRAGPTVGGAAERFAHQRPFAARFRVRQEVAECAEQSPCTGVVGLARQPAFALAVIEGSSRGECSLIGQEASWRYHYEPPQVWVKRHVLSTAILSDVPRRLLGHLR